MQASSSSQHSAGSRAQRGVPEWLRGKQIRPAPPRFANAPLPPKDATATGEQLAIPNPTGMVDAPTYLIK